VAVLYKGTLEADTPTSSVYQSAYMLRTLIPAPKIGEAQRKDSPPSRAVQPFRSRPAVCFHSSPSLKKHRQPPPSKRLNHSGIEGRRAAGSTLCEEIGKRYEGSARSYHLLFDHNCSGSSESSSEDANHSNIEGRGREGRRCVRMPTKKLVDDGVTSRPASGTALKRFFKKRRRTNGQT
jgi:hypothetical protein